MRSVFPIDFSVRYEKPVKLWRYPQDQHHVRKVERLREIADEVYVCQSNKSLQDPLHAIWKYKVGGEDKDDEIDANQIHQEIENENK